ncbi:MAG: hypothetical protein IPN92_08315 [Chromatiaceae bacterium]|nr:hypothetical protein [Chromatiaceae bacterium]
MEWEFTPEAVVKGDATYCLEDFRRDLALEVRGNLGPVSAAEFQRTYELIYDLCYWLATGKPFEGFLLTLEDDPAGIRLAKAVEVAMQNNVVMLGAILQRMIMDRVEGGMPLDDALAAVDAQHRTVAEVSRQLSH